MGYLRFRSRLVPWLLGSALLAGPIPSATAGPQASPATDRDRLLEWANGPVRWLLLPAELQRLREVSSAGGAVGFVERFWARRDPDPATAQNPFRERFFKRVEAADLLYPENGVRGSLTDRGRALILLGSPSRLRVTSQEALEWDPASGANDNVRVRYLPLEIWTYRLDDLERPLRLALMAQGDETDFRISFVRDVSRTSLREGEAVLELAARTALALDSEGE